MKNSVKPYLIFKWLIVMILLAMASVAYIKADYVEIIKQITKQGVPFIRLSNHTKQDLYCTIIGDRYFKDFHLRARRNSRWYVEPVGYYEWSCK